MVILFPYAGIIKAAGKTQDEIRMISLVCQVFY